MFILFHFIIFISSASTDSVTVPKCKIINYTGNATANSITFFSYNFDISVTFNSENETFPNIITFKNLTWNSLGSFGYKPVFPITVSPEISSNSFNCTIKDSDECEINFPNGIMIFYIDIKNESDTITIMDNTYLFFEDGYIFDGLDGTIFVNKNKCCNGLYSYNNITFSQQACCGYSKNLQISDTDVYETCTEFQTAASVTDSTNNLSLILNVSYLIAPVNDKEYQINMRFEISNYKFSSLLNYINHYIFGANTIANQCSGNINNSMTCYFNSSKILYSDIKQFDMIFTFGFLNFFGKQISYPEIIIGHLISMNGKFYKYFNDIFLPDDECWNNTATKNALSDAICNASFCCTKFKRLTSHDTSTSLEFITTTTTTTTRESTLPNISTTTIPNNATDIYHIFSAIIWKLWFLYFCFTIEIF